MPALTLYNSWGESAFGDNFGKSVAIAGTRVAVGAPHEVPTFDLGRVEIYDIESATPTAPLYTLYDPNPGGPAGFGHALAMSGNRLVVGSAGDPASSNTGRAYVYDLSGVTPDVPLLSLSGPSGYGIAVAVDGTRVAVSSPYEAMHTYRGRVYVYDLLSATPTNPVASLTIPQSGDHPSGFGLSVAISGTRVVVGFPSDNTGPDHGGCVYVYDLASSTPNVPVAKLRNPAAALDDNFGWSVAYSNDSIVVGAPYDDASGFNEGGAYVFTPNPNDQDNNGLLDSWEVTHFGSIGGHTAMGDDELDGAVNLLEEAFDTDPLSSDAPAIPATTNEGGYLTMTITKHPGVNYLVQSAATPDAAAFSAETTTVLVNDTSILKVRDNFPISTTPGRFLRVKVTAAP